MSQVKTESKAASKPAAKKGEDMMALLHHTLKDVYFAENQILKTLPSLMKAAQDAELKKALDGHKTETEHQIVRLEQIFTIMGHKPEGVPCEAIKGILKEGHEVLEKFGGTLAGDAGLIAACQSVEHYEICRYGTMKRWATEIGMKEVASLLDETLQEEYKADDAMTRIAEASANLKAESKSIKAHA